jgi:hypothetical protein
MDQPVNPDERDPSVTTVAAISLVAGLACTVAPATTALLAGIDATPGVVRAVGLADLALVGGSQHGAGLVRRAAVVAMAAGPRRLEPGHRRRVAGVSPITTRPSARCQPCSRHRLRPADRRPAPRRPPLTGTPPSAPQRRL